jgi:hypothetical protein
MPNLPPVIPMDDDFDLAALDVNQYLPPLVDPDAAAAAAATARSSAAVPHAPSSAAAARAVAVLVPDDALYAAARPSDAVATLRVEAEQPDGTWAQLGSMPPTARPEHLWRAFPSAMPVIGLTRRFKLTPLTHAGVALARAERVVTLDGSAAPVGSARPNTVASPPATAPELAPFAAYIDQQGEITRKMLSTMEAQVAGLTQRLREKDADEARTRHTIVADTLAATESLRASAEKAHERIMEEHLSISKRQSQEQVGITERVAGQYEAQIRIEQLRADKHLEYMAQRQQEAENRRAEAERERRTDETTREAQRIRDAETREKEWERLRHERAMQLLQAQEEQRRASDERSQFLVQLMANQAQSAQQTFAMTLEMQSAHHKALMTALTRNSNPLTTIKETLGELGLEPRDLMDRLLGQRGDAGPSIGDRMVNLLETGVREGATLLREQTRAQADVARAQIESGFGDDQDQDEEEEEEEESLPRLIAPREVPPPPVQEARAATEFEVRRTPATGARLPNHEVEVGQPASSPAATPAPTKARRVTKAADLRAARKCCGNIVKRLQEIPENEWLAAISSHLETTPITIEYLRDVGIEAAMLEADADPGLVRQVILAVDASGLVPADVPRRL